MSTYGQTAENPYANREGVTNVSAATAPTTSATPTVTYTPGGVARQPGYYNPSNPHDTGRHHEQNRELNNGAGGRLAGWNYDTGAPMEGVSLGADGLYQLGGGGMGGGGGGFNPESNPYFGQFKAAMAAQGAAELANSKAAIKTALIQFGLVPENFTDKWNVLDDSTKSLIKSNTDTGISAYARLLEGRSDAIRNQINSLQSRGLRRSGAKGYQLRRRQKEYDRNFQDALGSLMGMIGNTYSTYASNELARQQQLASFLSNIYANYYTGTSQGGGSNAGAAPAGTTYYNSAAGASPYKPQADGYYTGGALYATQTENPNINSNFWFK